MIEVVILVAFVGLQAGFHAAPAMFSHLRHCIFLQKMGEHGYVVWLFHPAILHGLQDYAIHFVIYSGRVIGGH